jgi:hypothetical protein
MMARTASSASRIYAMAVSAAKMSFPLGDPRPVHAFQPGPAA